MSSWPIASCSQASYVHVATRQLHHQLQRAFEPTWRPINLVLVYEALRSEGASHADACLSISTVLAMWLRVFREDRGGIRTGGPVATQKLWQQALDAGANDDKLMAVMLRCMALQQAGHAVTGVLCELVCLPQQRGRGEPRAGFVYSRRSQFGFLFFKNSTLILTLFFSLSFTFSRSYVGEIVRRKSSPTTFSCFSSSSVRSQNSQSTWPCMWYFLIFSCFFFKFSRIETTTVVTHSICCSVPGSYLIAPLINVLY